MPEKITSPSFVGDGRHFDTLGKSFTRVQKQDDVIIEYRDLKELKNRLLSMINKLNEVL